MSKAAVDALLAAWDESRNPILHSAAGQLRHAQRSRDPRSKVCEMCGREGTRGFIRSGGEWCCANFAACQSRIPE